MRGGTPPSESRPALPIGRSIAAGAAAHIGRIPYFGAPLACRASKEVTDGYRSHQGQHRAAGRRAGLPNPITDDDATLGEAGDAMRPQGEAPEMDKDDAEGPAPHASQMPR